MSVTITCTHKGDNNYTYRVSDIDRDSDLGFEVDINCIINGEYEHATRDEPENSNFKIDYDSFDPDFENFPKEVKARAIAWITIYENSSVYEDAFLASYYEIESDIMYSVVEVLLPYFLLDRNMNEKLKDEGSIYECAKWVISQLKSKICFNEDIFAIAKILETKWLRYVDFDLLVELDKIKQNIK